MEVFRVNYMVSRLDNLPLWKNTGTNGGLMVQTSLEPPLEMFHSKNV